MKKPFLSPALARNGFSTCIDIIRLFLGAQTKQTGSGTGERMHSGALFFWPGGVQADDEEFAFRQGKRTVHVARECAAAYEQQGDAE